MSPRRPSRAVSIPSVTLYYSTGCSLCERAREILDRVGHPYEAIDIGGDPALEERYREWLPVVEIDGERAFVYYLDEAAFRRKICHKRPAL